MVGRSRSLLHAELRAVGFSIRCGQSGMATWPPRMSALFTGASRRPHRGSVPIGSRSHIRVPAHVDRQDPCTSVRRTYCSPCSPRVGIAACSPKKEEPGPAAAPAAAPAATAAAAPPPVTSPAGLPTWTGDLASLKDRRVVRMLVVYSKTFYFIDKAQQRGITYELGMELEKFLNAGNKDRARPIRVVFLPVGRDQFAERIGRRHRRHRHRRSDDHARTTQAGRFHRGRRRKRRRNRRHCTQYCRAGHGR